MTHLPADTIDLSSISVSPFPDLPDHYEVLFRVGGETRRFQFAYAHAEVFRSPVVVTAVPLDGGSPLTETELDILGPRVALQVQRIRDLKRREQAEADRREEEVREGERAFRNALSRVRDARACLESLITDIDLLAGAFERAGQQLTVPKSEDPS